MPALDELNLAAEVSVKFDQLGVVQQTNLRFLERALRQQWSLGKNILMCWCVAEQGIEVLVAPHYFLGQFSASLNDGSATDRLGPLDGRFIRRLISGERQLSPRNFEETSRRLEITPTLIGLPVPIDDDDHLRGAIDALIKRYSISYVQRRAVLLFDIVNFSLTTPFEQTSQLSSLSYSLNSACNKLRKQNIEINFSRTTTGDGYYVWNSEVSHKADIDLFHFMLLVVADNAIAQRKAVGNTVPSLRTGFHVGSHYEFYQVEGLNPGMFSYIVGDVTIELARMVDLAQAGQIFIGDFETCVPTSERESAYLINVDSQRFVDRISKHMDSLRGIELSGEQIEAIHCYLTGETGSSAGQSIRRYRIIDKHGRSRNAYNLRINIRTGQGSPIILGMQTHRQRKSDQRERDGMIVRDARVAPRRGKFRPTISVAKD